MIKKSFMWTVAALTCMVAIGVCAEEARVKSPDGQTSLTVWVGKSIVWQVKRNGTAVIEPSMMGLEFKNQQPFGAMTIERQTTCTIDETWTNRLYKKELIRDHANEVTVVLREQDAPHRRLNLILRAYDGAVAFRYEIPAQPGFERVVLTKELTTWRFESDHLAWITTYPKHKTSQEEQFLHRSLQSIPAEELIGMPAIVEVREGTVMALCEADLTRWAGLFFKRAKWNPATGGAILECAPSPRLDGEGLVVTAAPCRSPWRVMIFGDCPSDLLANNDVILNLNPPPEGGDAAFDWVKPGATGWDWWVDSNNTISKELELEQIDFAAEMGWEYHTIDGGWYGRGPHTKLDTQKLDPLPELDFPALFVRAKEKNIGLWLWVYWSVLEANDPDATFARFADWGVKGVKIDFMDRQDQEMVEWYEKIVRIAAKHKLMINYHGAFKPTGMNRTWPNQITREGILGNEFNKFKPITAAHTATLPFTRFLLGPGDFTPGSFDNVHCDKFVAQMSRGHRYGDLSPESKASRIYANEIGTRAHALALCVTCDSPLMTLCDWPARYRGQAGLEALRKLPTVWRQTKVIGGSIGEGYAVAREAYDGRWYFAMITVKPAEMTLDLSFLPDGEWDATFYSDGKNAATDATDLSISNQNVTNKDKLSIRCVREGGAVIILTSKKI